jgi:DNA-binding ferritin-like protein
LYGGTRHGDAFVIAALKRVTVADELQGTVVELTDLMLIVTQLSWSVCGPGAAEVREQLDSLATRLRWQCDGVAARMLELGHVPNGQSRAVAIETDLTPLPTGLLPANEARDALGERLEELAARLTRSGESTVGDPRTAELLARIHADLMPAGALRG